MRIIPIRDPKDTELSDQRLPLQKSHRPVSTKMRRILELHYNLLFSGQKYMNKWDEEGIQDLQDKILHRYTESCFRHLLNLIQLRVDFKKIVNLVCLINFTVQGFSKKHHRQIILKVIENYPVHHVYTLLKIDSFGFFSLKHKILKISNFMISAKKQSIFEIPAK